MKIETGCLIELEYELRNSKGEVIETSTSGSLMTYLHGNEEIPPKLEVSIGAAGSDLRRGNFYTVVLDGDKATTRQREASPDFPQAVSAPV